jgi:bifunctional UDP-N-acetylglucosamine pyrophosphorylase/glucosamine-1-phosphate N-acetyltransferase
MRRAAVILAAGKGTRMPSDIPKVMHEVGDRPMVLHVVDTIRGVCDGGIFLVVGYMAEKVIEAVKGRGSVDEAVEFVYQREQLGTGHAVLQCEDALSGFDGTVIVLNGDVPGLKAETIEKFAGYHDNEGAAATVLTATVERPAGYGRIVKDSEGALLRIVEEKDASDEEKKIREINSGLFCFDKSQLFGALKSTDRENAQNEYYLTDIIDVLKQKGESVRAFCVDDPREVSGVNTVQELEAVRSYLEGSSK